MGETGFTNEAIGEASLPRAQTLAYEGLAPTYARTMIIEWLVAWAIVTAVNSGLHFFTPNETLAFITLWLFIPLFLIALSVLIWAPLVARSRGFALREHDIHYKSGLIWRKTVSLPFNRIQHVELESGPLERLFKLTTLKFFTAGGGSTDMKIPALTFTRATTLRSYVLEQAGMAEASLEDTAA